MASSDSAAGRLQPGVVVDIRVDIRVLASLPDRCYAFGLTNCPFCSLSPDRLRIETEHGVAVPDAHPVIEGHTLVVPRKQVSTIYQLIMPEQQGIWKLVAEVRERLLEALKPGGFNIGFNDGLAAGQTVEHAHVHVIPRRTGDVPDPRGGIRWVIADNAPYWKK